MYRFFTYIFIIAKNTFSTKKKLFFQMFNHIVFMIFVFFLYKNVYLLAPSVSSKIPIENAIWSMSMYFVVFWLGFRNLERKFRKDIKSGDVEMYLLRPMHYVLQKIMQQFGEGILPFVFSLITSFFISYLLVGFPIINAPFNLFILAVVIIFFLSQILTIFIYTLVGLSSFWLEDSEPIYFIVSKLIMIFGGAWVPVAFFPILLQRVAEYSPFGASMSLVFAMYPNFMDRFSFLAMINIFWIFILGTLVYFVSKNAYKKLSVNG